jgi:hypothetical protein
MHLSFGKYGCNSFGKTSQAIDTSNQNSFDPTVVNFGEYGQPELGIKASTRGQALF